MEGGGYFTEIVVAAFSETEYAPVFKFLPWKRAEADLESGAVFGIFPYVKTDERVKNLTFQSMLQAVQDVFFIIK